MSDATNKPLIGILMSIAANDSDAAVRREAILQGLNRKDVQIVSAFARQNRWDSADYATAAANLISLGPRAVFSSCWPTMRQLAAATRTIPIVYAGLFNQDAATNNAYNFAGNVTGFVSHQFDVCPQWPQLLQAIAPGLTQAAVIYEDSAPGAGGPSQRSAIKIAGGSFVPGTNDIDVSNMSNDSTLTQAIAALSGKNIGLIVTTGALIAGLSDTIIQAASSAMVPAIYPNRLYVARGGLMSYGTPLLELYRSAGAYLGKILDGVTIDNLPTKMSGKDDFELAINSTTAQKLEISIPPNLLDQARWVFG